MSFEKRENFTQNILTNLLNNTPTNYLLCSLWVMCKKYLSVCYAFWEMRVKKNRESCYTHPHITTREIICEIFEEILRKCEIKRVGTKTVEHREHIYSQKKNLFVVRLPLFCPLLTTLLSCWLTVVVETETKKHFVICYVPLSECTFIIFSLWLLRQQPLQRIQTTIKLVCERW